MELGSFVKLLYGGRHSSIPSDFPLVRERKIITESASHGPSRWGECTEGNAYNENDTQIEKNQEYLTAIFCPFSFFTFLYTDPETEYHEHSLSSLHTNFGTAASSS
jgi:hypothetical protein